MVCWTSTIAVVESLTGDGEPSMQPWDGPLVEIIHASGRKGSSQKMAPACVFRLTRCLLVCSKLGYLTHARDHGTFPTSHIVSTRDTDTVLPSIERLSTP